MRTLLKCLACQAPLLFSASVPRARQETLVAQVKRITPMLEEKLRQEAQRCRTVTAKRPASEKGSTK